MSQEISNLHIKDLVLWTENPRDPIDADATDQEVVKKAVEDTCLKWTLAKLAKEMGPHYDYSELPTVVFHAGRPVVYDGNRRIILGKIKHGFVMADGFNVSQIPVFPSIIPCNVCSLDVALKNVYRKHADTGSWLPLERDIFLYKHMKEKKTPFLILDEATGVVSKNPHLNQRFVKEEIFKEDMLRKLGVQIKGEKLLSKHSSGELLEILDDLSKKVGEKEITTRKNRGKVIEVLSPSIQRIISGNKDKEPHEVDIDVGGGRRKSVAKPQRSRRVRAGSAVIFGDSLFLRIGIVSNLYRDIIDLYEFYKNNRNSLSDKFPSLIRMALRLISEAAAKDENQTLERYIKSRFDDAKASLDQNIKTTLSNQNVTKDSIMQLLHTGAHNYTSAANLDQTLAMSVVIGAILTLSHGKDVGHE